MGIPAEHGESPKPTFTDADFDTLSFHDCHIHGLELRTGDPDVGDWTHDLAFDIDYIVDGWLRTNGQWAFLVAPAWLVFHDVTGLRIAVDWRREGPDELIHTLSISQIVRRRVEPPTPQRGPAYEWCVESDWPDNGSISFGATSFTLKLRSDPVETDNRQRLSTQQRRHL